jgi:ectoine hydroxylase
VGPLTPRQVADFQGGGFLLLGDCFGPAELLVLQGGVAPALAARDERTILEASGEAVRSVYGLHSRNRVFSLLARHPRIVGPVRQLLGGEVYVYQSKLNVKSPFVGDVWEWHQDYIYWRDEDAMPAPRVVTAAVYIDDVDEFNGPLVMIPGSHREGVLPCQPAASAPAAAGPPWLAHLSARLKYTIDRNVLTALARRHGLLASKAAAGAVLLFDGNLAHASAPNISPFARSIALFTYNHIDNAPPRAKLTRPEFLASRDERPITAVADDVFASEAR